MIIVEITSSKVRASSRNKTLINIAITGTKSCTILAVINSILLIIKYHKLAPKAVVIAP
jgi:hypothetical protein